MVLKVYLLDHFIGCYYVNIKLLSINNIKIGLFEVSPPAPNFLPPGPRIHAGTWNSVHTNSPSVQIRSLGSEHTAPTAGYLDLVIALIQR